MLRWWGMWVRKRSGKCSIFVLFLLLYLVMILWILFVPTIKLAYQNYWFLFYSGDSNSPKFQYLSVSIPRPNQISQYLVLNTITLANLQPQLLVFFLSNSFTNNPARSPTLQFIVKKQHIPKLDLTKMSQNPKIHDVKQTIKTYNSCWC